MLSHDTQTESRSFRPRDVIDWTDEKIEAVRRHWLEGKSATEIGMIIGCSRNAVIGIIYRKKITRGAVNRPHRKSDGTKPHGNKGKPKASTIVARLARKMRGPELDAAPLPEEDEGVDVTKLIGLMQLNEHTCKFMHGDPLKADSGFCGKPTCTTADGRQLPYCEHHARRTYHGLVLAGDEN